MSIGSQSLAVREISSRGGEFNDTLEANESSRSSGKSSSTSSRKRWLFLREGNEGARKLLDWAPKKDISLGDPAEWKRFCFL